MASRISREMLSEVRARMRARRRDKRQPGVPPDGVATVSILYFTLSSGLHQFLSPVTGA